MASVDKIAKERLRSMQEPNPFSQLDRDLPKGGRQIPVAEPLSSSPIPAAASAGARGVLPAATAVGMLIPTPIGEEQPIVDTGNKGVAGPLPQEIKGDPVMQEMTAPTKEQIFRQKFENEGKKHLGQEFSLGIEDQTGERPEHYKLKGRTEGDVSERDLMKAAGMHSVIRKQGAKSGTVNLPDSKSNKTYLEEDDE